MSRIRDIANILTTANSMATDAEVSTAMSNHSTAVNGHIGRGTTGQRPASPSVGDTYFDTTLAALISYKSAGWEKVSQDPAPQIASISPATAGTSGTTITITGSSFKSGLSVQFIGADATSYNSPVATFINGTTATATTPTLSVANEPYDVKVINNDNQFAILENALDAGGSPTWNTASGTLVTINEQTSLNTSVSATDPDGTSIIYSSSNLPVATPTPVSFAVTNSGYGAYLMNGVSNGAITLTRGGTYTFNVNASGHPFYIQTTGNGYNSYNVYSTGVTGAGAQVGTVTFVVPNDAPNTLFYQCQYHSAMFGQINIISASPWITLNSSTGALTGTAPDIAANTTYNFNVTASDGVNTSSRAFNVVVNYVIPFTTSIGFGSSSQVSSFSSHTGQDGIIRSAGKCGPGTVGYHGVSLNKYFPADKDFELIIKVSQNSDGTSTGQNLHYMGIGYVFGNGYSDSIADTLPFSDGWYGGETNPFNGITGTKYANYYNQNDGSDTPSANYGFPLFFKFTRVGNTFNAYYGNSYSSVNNQVGNISVPANVAGKDVILAFGEASGTEYFFIEKFTTLL